MKILNLERLKRRIRQMPAATKTEIQKGLANSAKDMVAMAKLLVPKDEGDLERSINYTIGDYRPNNPNVRGVQGKAGAHDLAVTIHAGDSIAYYAAFVEFGTKGHAAQASRRDRRYKKHVVMTKGSRGHAATKAQPFFFPAYRLTRKRMKSKLSRAMRRAIKKAAS